MMNSDLCRIQGKIKRRPVVLESWATSKPCWQGHPPTPTGAAAAPVSVQSPSLRLGSQAQRQTDVLGPEKAPVKV